MSIKRENRRNGRDLSLARQNRESLCRPHRGTLHARRQELSQREEHRVAGIKAYRHNNTQTAREESAPRSPLSLFSAMPVGSANLSPFSPLRLHRVYNISNTAYEIFQTRCLKYYAGGEKKNNAISRYIFCHPLAVSIFRQIRACQLACPDLLLKTITIALVIQDCKNDAYHSITDSTSSQMERTLD